VKPYVLIFVVEQSATEFSRHVIGRFGINHGVLNVARRNVLPLRETAATNASSFGSRNGRNNNGAYRITFYRFRRLSNVRFPSTRGCFVRGRAFRRKKPKIILSRKRKLKFFRRHNFAM